VRFAIWMAIGLGIYVFYGYWHSNERSSNQDGKFMVKYQDNNEHVLIDSSPEQSVLRQ